MKIAVVDDQEMVRKTFCGILRIRNYDVECYHSAEDFLANAQVDDFCCLLVDFRLPGKNGIELIHDLRDSNRWTPVILISGNMDEKIEQSIADLKSIATLRKPCSAVAILEKVEQFRAPID